MPFWTDLFGGTPTTTASTTTVTTRRIYTSAATAGDLVYWTDYNSPDTWLATSTPTATSSGAVYWAAMDPQSQTHLANAAYLNQQMAARARAYERYSLAMNDWRITAIGDRPIYTPSAPAIIRPRDQLRLDREAYARALEEHNEQEAARLQREIERHERLDAEQRRAAEERAQAAREAQAQREIAKSVARGLLLEHLTPAQRDTFTKNGWFIVEGGKSGTRYRISTRGGVAGNIDVLEKISALRGGGERVTHRLCCHAADSGIPNADQWLAQKIMLELAEDDFLRKANRHAA